MSQWGICGCEMRRVSSPVCAPSISRLGLVYVYVYVYVHVYSYVSSLS